MSVYLFVASLEEEMKLKEVPLCESSPADKNRTERGVRLSGTGFTYYVQDPGLGHWGRGEDGGRERERGEGVGRGRLFSAPCRWLQCQTPSDPLL